MAHGFGGTRDTGLLDYAEGFADAGLDVLVFDYRGFGTSDGATRQRVSYRHQREDYHAAIAAARALPGVDPERIVLWGTSYSGGHVVPVAVADGRIAAIVSLTPAMDGLAALARHREGAPHQAAAAGRPRPPRRGRAACFGRSPHHLPIVGAPGSTAMITAPGALEGYHALAGPTWRNEVCARVALEVALQPPEPDGRAAAHADPRPGRRERPRRASGRGLERRRQGGAVRRGPQLPARPLRRLRGLLAAADPRRPDRVPRPTTHRNERLHERLAG